MLLVVDQSLVEMAGTDGQAKKGRVVVVIPAVEAGAITFSCPLEMSVGKIPPFLWVAHGLCSFWHPTIEQVYQ